MVAWVGLCMGLGEVGNSANSCCPMAKSEVQPKAFSPTSCLLAASCCLEGPLHGAFLLRDLWCAVSNQLFPLVILV